MTPAADSLTGADIRRFEGGVREFSESVAKLERLVRDVFAIRPHEPTANLEAPIRELSDAVQRMAAQSQRQPHPDPTPKRFLSIADAARLIGCSTRTMRRNIHLGDLPHVRAGRLIRIKATDLDSWLHGKGNAPIDRH